MKLFDITLINFRCFKNETISFFDKTVIRALNGSGKSTIPEAVVWCLYETDIRGKKKANSRLMRHKQKTMSVTANFVSDSGASYSISRIKPETGSIKLMINGKRAKPGEIEGLFGDKAEDFLSIFIPGYFSSLEPEKAKAVLANCIPNVSMDEVLRLLPAEKKELLQNEKFALGIDSAELLAKTVRGEIADIQKDILRLEGQAIAYREVSAKGEIIPPVSKLTKKSHENYKRAKSIQTSIENRHKEAREQLVQISAKRDALRSTTKQVMATLKMASCLTCGQEISKHRSDEINEHFGSMVEEGLKLSQQIETLQSELGNTELLKRTTEYIQDFDKVASKEQVEFDMYAADVRMAKEAKQKLIEIAGSMDLDNQELFKIQEKLRAVQSLKMDYIGFQHKKLNHHFSNVQINLTKVNLETGELTPNFEITWQQKPYNTLSHSERVRCDVEIGYVLAIPKGERMPVFIDDAEGVQNVFDQNFSGQVIAAYVFDSGKLLVDSLEGAKTDIMDEMQNMLSLLGGKVSGF